MTPHDPGPKNSNPTPEKSLWTRKVEAEPDHSLRFLQRFRDMRAAGKDIVGEARFVDAMAPRGARILDAGCGSGRTGGPLAELGHEVVGVDVDPVLIEAAREDFPRATWLVGDLAEFSLTRLADGTATNTAANTAANTAGTVAAPFDVIVAAGNVLPFLAPSTRRRTLANLRASVAAGGRMALGFGAGRGYPFAEFRADARASGWRIDSQFRGWNLLPFDEESDFLVAVLSPVVPGRSTPDGADVDSDRAGQATDVGARSSTEGNATGRGGFFGPSRRGSGADPMGGHCLQPLHGDRSD